MKYSTRKITELDQVKIPEEGYPSQESFEKIERKIQNIPDDYDFSRVILKRNHNAESVRLVQKLL